MTKFPFEELQRHILENPDITARQLAEKVGAKSTAFIQRFGTFRELKKQALVQKKPRTGLGKWIRKVKAVFN